MIQVQFVPLEHFYQVWPIVEPMLKKSLDASPGDVGIEHLKVYILGRLQTLIVAVEKDTIIGAGTLQIENQPNNRVLSITTTGGRGIANKEVFSQVETWAKSQGVTKIKVIARELQARLYRQKLGLVTEMYVMEKSI
jgi:hypothetical protein